MGAKFGPLKKKEVKNIDINRDKSFQKSGRVQPLLTIKERINFGRNGSRTIWLMRN